MQLTANKATFVDALTVASRVASNKSAIMATRGVLVDVAGGHVLLRATDLETSVSIRLSVEAHDGSGRVLLPATLLLEVVKACPNPSVTLAVGKENGVTITSGAASFDLRTLRLEDFPTLPHAEPEDYSDLALAPFITAVERVADSASKDETRPVLAGINMRLGGHQLRAVATDSYRLAVSSQELNEASRRDFELTLPTLALQELARIAKNRQEEKLSVAVAGNHFLMSLPGVTLSTRAIAGQFPDPDRLIPQTFASRFTYKADELASALKRVSLLCRKGEPAVLTVNGEGLTCHATSADIGSALEVIPEIKHQGEPVTLGINPSFLAAALAQHGSDEVELRLVSPMRPVLVTNAAETLSHVIMPIRLN